MLLFTRPVTLQLQQLVILLEINSAVHFPYEPLKTNREAGRGEKKYVLIFMSILTGPEGGLWKSSVSLDNNWEGDYFHSAAKREKCKCLEEAV